MGYIQDTLKYNCAIMREALHSPSVARVDKIQYKCILTTTVAMLCLIGAMQKMKHRQNPTQHTR